MVGGWLVLAMAADGRAQPVPRSDGSEDADGGPMSAGRREPRGRGADESPAGAGMSDDFDSDEFRGFLRMRRMRGRSHGGRRGDDHGGLRGEEDGEWKGGGNHSKPPEWDGEAIPFQDWLIKARLWLATTKVRKKTQGPMILQGLSGVAFQTFKHWAKDVEWLQNEDGGVVLLEAMNLPENFGEDRDEDLLSALAKITYHLRRERHEDHRTFFNRWEEALRRVSEHGVVLPDQYKGFLLVNAMALSEQDIMGLLNFTRGSIATKDVKEWTRKHETKLMVKEVGTDTQRKGKTTSGTSSSSAVHRMTAEETGDFHDEDEILEAVLEELDGDEDTVQPDGDQEGEEEPLEEHEIREVLNTMFQKRTFTQSLKLKKAKELARGYGGWKGSGKDKGKQGKSKLIDQMKQNSRCAICKKIGHWHRECPDGKGRGKTGPKEAYYLQNLATEETEEAFFCGHLEVDPEPLPDEQLAKLNDEMLFRLADPEDREMKEIYGDQYRHFDETYEPGDEWFWQDATEVETDVKEKTSPIPPSVAMSSTSPSRTEPVNGEHDPEDRLFDVVSSSHTVAGGKQHVRSRYKVQCMEIGGGIGSHVHEMFYSRDDFGLRGKASENHENLEGTRGVRQKTKQSRSGRQVQEDCCATIDTGCQRMAVGAETLYRLAKQLPQDMMIGTLPQEHRFRSVNGTSTTTHSASIPTSLGNKGSILRPAIFNEGESRQAPFLISLPFLLHCRAVLYLDPQKGLRLYLRRFDFGVDCHLGPTGALRVPLNQLTMEQMERLQKAHEQLQHQSTEFEVMKMTMKESFGSDNKDKDSRPRSEDPSVESGHEAQPNRGEPVHECVGENGDEAPLRDDSTDRALNPIGDGRGADDRCRAGGGLGSSGDGTSLTVQCMAQPGSAERPGRLELRPPTSSRRATLLHRDQRLSTRSRRHSHRSSPRKRPTWNIFRSSPRRRSTWNNSRSTSRKGGRSASTREPLAKERMPLWRSSGA